MNPSAFVRAFEAAGIPAWLFWAQLAVMAAAVPLCIFLHFDRPQR